MAYNKRQRNRTRAKTLVAQMERSQNQIISIMQDYGLDTQTMTELFETYSTSGEISYDGSYSEQIMILFPMLIALTQIEQMASLYHSTI